MPLPFLLIPAHCPSIFFISLGFPFTGSAKTHHFEAFLKRLRIRQNTHNTKMAHSHIWDRKNAQITHISKLAVKVPFHFPLIPLHFLLFSFSFLFISSSFLFLSSLFLLIAALPFNILYFSWFSFHWVRKNASFGSLFEKTANKAEHP